MRSEVLTGNDPVYLPKTSYGPLDRRLLGLINDPRDLPFVHFILEATCVILPFAAFLYFGSYPWLVAALYVPFNIALYMDRYILILHNTSHRPLFKAKYRILNGYIPRVLGPFFGESPDTYFVHHIGMHHVEENLEDDLSSTMPFRRDSFVAWLGYFLRFFFAGLTELGLYLVKRRRRKLLVRLIAGEVGFLVAVAGLWLVNPRATLVVFVIPLLFCRFIMMAGNWGQHAFIDPARPSDPFASSVTVINCRYNRRSFNDGYHIGHHRKATRHWTEMPVEFLRDRELYARGDAIVFSGIDFTMVWFFLMLKRYDLLARRFVDLQSPPRSQEAITALLKERTRAIPFAEPAPALSAE